MGGARERRARARRAAGCGAWLILALSAPAAALDVPFLAGRLNDHAQLLDTERSARLEGKLRVVEEKTGAQVALLTLDSLEGDSLEEFSHRVASTWKLGREGKDDGVLLLIAKNDRKMRIEVGYGLEAQLTDAESGRILNDLVRPQFRAGDFGGGIETGVDAILGQIYGTGTLPAAPPKPPTPWVPLLVGVALFLLAIGVFSFVAIFAPKPVAWPLYFMLMAFYLAFPAMVRPWLGIGLWGLWTVAFPVARYLLGHTDSGKRWVASSPWASSLGTGWTTSSGGGSSSSGSSGGGGFSGGGGSFGGGGASSSW